MKAISFFIIYLFSFGFLYSQSFNSYIVKFRSTSEINRFFIESGNKEQNFRLIEISKQSKYKDASLSAQSIKLMQNLENYVVINKSEDLQGIKQSYEIESIAPNYIYHIEQTIAKPNDPKYSEQWALKNINAEFAWKKASGKGVIVGVIDTGIDFEHPELINSLWINSKEDINKNGKFDPWSSKTQNNGINGDFDGIDNDGNGFIDDVIGYDFVDQKKANIGDAKFQDAVPFDEMGHGTLVSGIIAAERDNKTGITGLAYNSKIMMMRTFDIMGNAESHNIASAILYAALNKAKVINCSFGDLYSTPVVYDAIKFAQSMGCVVVASSGNNGWDDPHYPSDYEGVISVGGSDIQNRRYGFSNYGDNLAFLAPGANVLSTDFFNTYSTKNGTSFSAPHVSALAAMLLEINPNLDADEIKTMIAHSAKMPKTTDWSTYWGAGIIDAGEAVNNTPPMKINISFPRNEEIIQREKVKFLPIIGTVQAPLISDSYEVYFGLGYNPTKWSNAEILYNIPVINDTLTKIPLYNFDIDTNYTLKLVFKMKNGKIIEQRRRFSLINQNSLKILNVNILQAWDNGVLGTIAGVTTSLPSKAKVVYTTQAGKLIESSDFINYSYYHTIKINKPERISGNVSAKIIAELTDGTKTERPISLTLSDQYFPIENYNIKNYKFKPSYLFDGTKKLYNNEQTIVANDLTGGVLGKLYSYNFNSANKTFETIDSLDRTLIPVGMGDSNGDGINEVLFKASGNCILYQGTVNDDNPFSRIIFENSFGNFWAQGLFNIDNQPNEELVCYSDTAYHIWSYVNGNYKQLAQTKLPPRFKKLGTLPGLAVGDFDKDGNKDIAFSNDNGNLFVFNYKNNELSLQFIDSVNYSKSSQYMSSLDFDGDGADEIAILDNTTSPLFNIEDFGEPIWSLRVYKYEAPNSYKVIWSTYFSGVITGATRSGVNIRNGLTCGDINGDTKEEVVISIFPNVYAFSYDAKNTFKPELILKDMFTNNVLINDFDKNGTNEIGFSDGNATYFAEVNNAAETPETPINFKGKLINPNTIEFSWDKTSNAEYYKLYRAVLNGNYYSLILIDEVQSTEITIDTFKMDQTYEFILAAVNTSYKNQKSNYSNLLKVRTALPWTIKDIKIKDNFLEVIFAGKLKPEPIETNIFTLLDEKNKSLVPLSILPASDSILIITFDLIPYGSLGLQNEEFLDYWDNLVFKSKFKFEHTKPVSENPELYLTTLQNTTDHYKFTLYFSEELDMSSFSESSFKIYTSYDDDGKPVEFEIANFALNSNKKGIDFELERNQTIFASGRTYFITCLNGKSITGNAITSGSGNTLAFVITSDDISKAYVYPNPIKLSTRSSAYFSNLPPRAVIEIYNLSMNKIRELTESDGNGGVKWDLRDDSGNTLDSGIYLFKVIKYNWNQPSEESEFIKFAIVK